MRGLARCTTAPQYGEDTHSMLPNPRPAPAPARVPIIRVGAQSTSQHHTECRLSAPRVSCVLPGRGRESCGAGVWCCVVLCCVVQCYGGVAVKINCVVLCDVSRQLIAAGPRGRTTQSLVYSLQPGSGSGGGSSHTGSGHTRHASM